MVGGARYPFYGSVRKELKHGIKKSVPYVISHRHKPAFFNCHFLIRNANQGLKTAGKKQTNNGNASENKGKQALQRANLGSELNCGFLLNPGKKRFNGLPGTGNRKFALSNTFCPIASLTGVKIWVWLSCNKDFCQPALRWALSA